MLIATSYDPFHAASLCSLEFQASLKDFRDNVFSWFAYCTCTVDGLDFCEWKINTLYYISYLVSYKNLLDATLQDGYPTTDYIVALSDVHLDTFSFCKI